MLHCDAVLNSKKIGEIIQTGYTRIPVYGTDRNNVVSLLNVKDLALLDPDDNFTVRTLCSYYEHPVRFVMEDTPLKMMLDEFRKVQAVHAYTLTPLLHRDTTIWPWCRRLSNPKRAATRSSN
jgi:metal transporter CNNM